MPETALNERFDALLERERARAAQEAETLGPETQAGQARGEMVAELEEIAGQPPGVASPTEAEELEKIEAQRAQAESRAKLSGHAGRSARQSLPRLQALQEREAARVEQEGRVRAATRLPAAQRAEVAGLSPEGAPKSARAISGFGLEGIDPTQTATAALTAAMGQPVEVFRMSEDDPLFPGELVFRHPETGRLTTWNDLDSALGEVSEMAGVLPIVATETAGGAAGTAAGLAMGRPILGAAVGTAIGAAAGDYARIQMGHALWGLNKGADPREVILSNLGEGALATTAFLSFSLGAFVLRRVAKGALFSGVTPGQAEELMRAAAEAEAEAAHLRQVIGKDFGMPASMALRSIGDQPTVLGGEVYSLERALRAMPGTQSRTFVEGDIARRRAYQEYFAAIEEEAGLPAAGAFDDAEEVATATARRVGETYQAEIARRLSAMDRRAARVAEGAEAREAEAAARVISRRSENPTGAIFESELGQVRREEAVAFARMEGEKYNEIRDLAIRLGFSEEGFRVPIESFAARTREAQSVLSKRMLQRLDEADRGAVEEALRISQIETGATVQEVMGTISQLRSAVRAAEAGLGSADISVSTLRKMLKGLLEDRALWLRGKPEIAAAVEEAEQFVRNGKQLLDRSIVGQIDAIPQGKVFDRLFASGAKTAKQNADAVAQLLKSPYRGLAEMAPAERRLYERTLERVRGGFLHEYERRVLPKRNPSARANAHATFLRDFDPLMSRFFSPDEMSEIRRLGGISLVAQRRAERVKDLRRIARSIPEVRDARLSSDLVATGSPGDVFQRVWASGDRTATRKALRMARRDPEFFGNLRVAAQADFRNAVFVRGSDGFVEASSESLGKYLAKHRGQMVDLFGERYVENLDVIRKVMSREARQHGVGAEFNEASNALIHLVRAAVGLFTVKGRIMTAALRMRRGGVQTQLSKILLDPEQTTKLVELGRYRPREIAARRIMGALGLTTALDVDPVSGDPVILEGAARAVGGAVGEGARLGAKGLRKIEEEIGEGLQ